MRNEGAPWGRAEFSDAELLGAAQEDPEAFGAFYDRHVRAILGFFYHRTACAQTAADLTAETFAQAFASRHTFRDLGVPARAWILGIARHELQRMLRRRRVDGRARRRLGMERMAVDDLAIERIEELVDTGPLRAVIREAFDSLTPKLAEAVALRVGLSLPYEEVARQLGCSEGTARVRVARGLTRLRELLEAT